MASTQSVHLGHAEATHVQVALDRLRAQQFLPRLWDRDPTLWSTDPAVQASIRRRLGWLTISRTMEAEAEPLRRFAEEIREGGLTWGLLLGMGGSGLFAEVCRQTLGVSPGALDLTVLDTTDPTAIRAHQARGPLQQLLVIVSSKSGSTSEVSALSAYFHELLKTVGGPRQCVAITDAGTALDQPEARAASRRTFVHGPGTGAEVGGRFSALTYFGLVPAALMGVDVARFLRHANAMFARCGPAVPLDENPAAELGALLGALALGGQDKLTLFCAPALASVGTWLEQLVAENFGKMGRGIVPIHGEPLVAPDRYTTDRVFVEFQLATDLDARLERHVDELVNRGRPVVRIRWDDRDDLGQEVAKWCMASAVIGGLLEINPFDEPNVTESKDRTKTLLEAYGRGEGLCEPAPPISSDDAFVVYGSEGFSPSASLTQCLRELFRRVRPNDYVALLSFLPRTPSLDRTMQELRGWLAMQLGQATMVQFGPRYLHSTGQLYKGGPDAGVFLLFTAAERDDLPIPGARFTFGVLKHAQALGDFQAMAQRGRRLLHVHLRSEPGPAMRRVSDAIHDVVASGARTAGRL